MKRCPENVYPFVNGKGQLSHQLFDARVLWSIATQIVAIHLAGA